LFSLAIRGMSSLAAPFTEWPQGTFAVSVDAREEQLHVT
jgi:hypothetical protein